MAVFFYPAVIAQS